VRVRVCEYERGLGVCVCARARARVRACASVCACARVCMGVCACARACMPPSRGLLSGNLTTKKPNDTSKDISIYKESHTKRIVGLKRALPDLKEPYQSCDTPQ